MMHRAKPTAVSKAGLPPHTEPICRSWVHFRRTTGGGARRASAATIRGGLGLTQSLGDLGATLVAGILWSVFTPAVAFGYAAAWMTASVLTAWWLRPGPST